MNTTSPTSRYAKFLNQFAFAVENHDASKGDGMNHVRWTANVGYVDLGLNACALARIELASSDTTFGGFRVEIINRQSGKLDSLYFSFNDILDPSDRADSRLDHKGFHGWSSSVAGGTKDVEWYIAKPSPKNIMRFVAAVNEYLTMWQGTR